MVKDTATHIRERINRAESKKKDKELVKRVDEIVGNVFGIMGIICLVIMVLTFIKI